MPKTFFFCDLETSGVLASKTNKAISSGCDYTCDIASDDQIYCCGYNVSGQIGINTFSDSVSLPTIISYPY